MIKVDSGRTAGQIFWRNFNDFKFKNSLSNQDIAFLIYRRTEYGHNRKSAQGISSNISQLTREKNNPNNIIANALLYVISYVEKRDITYSDMYTVDYFK